MVAIKNLAFFLAAVSAFVIPRDAATILNDLKVVDTQLNKLNSDAKSWSGSLFTAGTIQSDANNLESDIKTLTNDTQATSSLSSSDATTIINYINSPLMADINSALAELQARKSDIQKDGLSSTVKGALQDIKSETDSFGSAFSPLLSSSQKSTFSSQLAKIDSEFTQAISTFS